jgi:hypothetical protein
MTLLGRIRDWQRCGGIHQFIILGGSVTRRLIVRATRRKELVGHGKWIPWLKANVEFTEATACNYMRLFEYRDWLKSKMPILDLTDAYQKIDAKRKAEGAKSRSRGSQKPPSELKESDPEPESQADEQTRDPELRTLVINALCGMGIPQREAGKLVDTAVGDTEEEIIEGALRQHGQAKLPGQMSTPKNDESDPPPDVQIPEPSVEQPASSNDSDHADAAAPPTDSVDPLREPLVSLVKEPDPFSKLPDHWRKTIHITESKLYHLVINDKTGEEGWLAAYDQLGIDGPLNLRSEGWARVVAKTMESLAAQPLQGSKPDEPTEDTCFSEYLRLLRQLHVKLKGNQSGLDKLRKAIQRTSNPKYWAQFGKELSE